MRNGSTRHKHFALILLKLIKLQNLSTNFMNFIVPLALETYGGTSENFEKLFKENLPKQPNSTIFHALSC